MSSYETSTSYIFVKIVLNNAFLQLDTRQERLQKSCQIFLERAQLLLRYEAELIFASNWAHSNNLK